MELGFACILALGKQYFMLLGWDLATGTDYTIDFKLHLLKSAIWLHSGKRSHYEPITDQTMKVSMGLTD